MRLTPSERGDADRSSGPGYFSAAPEGASHGPTWDRTSLWVSADTWRILPPECDRPTTLAGPRGRGLAGGGGGPGHRRRSQPRLPPRQRRSSIWGVGGAP